jgi:flagellar assembly protein FliH
LSKIIKASRIKGEYKLSDIEVGQADCEDKKAVNPYNRKQSSESDQEISENIKKGRSRADEIIAEARDEASKIKNNAEKQAKNIKEQASDEGFEQGYQEGKNEGFAEGKKEGYEAGLQQLSESLTTLNLVINETKKELEDEIKQFPAEVIKLSSQIASRVVNFEIEINPELINNIIIDILEEIGTAHGDILIKVNPVLIEYIEEAKVDSNLDQQVFEITGDDKLKTGDCVIETEFGGKDATLSNKFDLIEKKLYQGAGYDGES